MDAKCRKNCNWCQAQENVQSVQSAGKRATAAKREKTCNRMQIAAEQVKVNIAFGFAPDCLKKGGKKKKTNRLVLIYNPQCNWF